MDIGDGGDVGQVLFLQIKLGQLSGISIVDKERPFSYAAVLLFLLLLLLLLVVVVVVVVVGGVVVAVGQHSGML